MADWAPRDINREKAVYDAEMQRVAAADDNRGDPDVLARRAVTALRAAPTFAYTARRAYLHGRQAIGDDWDGRKVLAWPSAERQLRRGRLDDFLALSAWRSLTDLATHPAANDNRQQLPTPDEDGEANEQAADGVIDQADTELRIRPTLSELRGALRRATERRESAGRAADRAPHTVVRDDRRGNLRNRARRLEIGCEFKTNGDPIPGTGELAFDGRSHLIEFRAGTGRWEKPREVRIHRKDRKPLEAPPAQLGPGVGTVDDHIDAVDRLAALSRVIGAQHVAVLELACGPATAREIGETLGASGKTAERRGVAAVDAAIAALRATNPSNAG
jgi:hypothetical protein